MGEHLLIGEHVPDAIARQENEFMAGRQSQASDLWVSCHNLQRMYQIEYMLQI